MRKTGADKEGSKTVQKKQQTFHKQSVVEKALWSAPRKLDTRES